MTFLQCGNHQGALSFVKRERCLLMIFLFTLCYHICYNNIILILFTVGLYCSEALWTRYLPAYQKVREIINSKAIGDVIHIAAHFIISNNTDRMLYKK